MTAEKKKTIGPYFAVVDMGTTNTVLSLTDSTAEPLSSVHGAFGVRDCATSGRKDVLIKGLKGLLDQALEKSQISADQIECMLCAGMITSDIGLVEIPHLTAPVDAGQVAARVRRISLPQILTSPIICIPGIKNRVATPCMDTLGEMDFMRGEETQVFGALQLYGLQPPVTFMFLSSHTKLIDVDEKHRITRSFTTLSGQIFQALRFQSLLASSLPKKTPAEIDESSLLRGVEAGLADGILRAALMVRFMDTLMSSSAVQRFSFLEGILIAADLRAIQNSYPHMRARLAVLGNQFRCRAYCTAFSHYFDPAPECIYLGKESMDQCAIAGALKIAGTLVATGKTASHDIKTFRKTGPAAR